MSTSPKKGKKARSAARYDPAKDRTLTKQQRRSKFFRAYGIGADFRSRSNRTLAGYSTGYHEAAITTDTFNFLRRAVDNGDGTHTLPNTTSKRSFWANHAGETVFSEPLQLVLKYADGFRTDTAQTILSASRGRAAGHSGSGIDTGRQSDAHDLLRRSVYDILVTDPASPGFSERSVSTLLSSIVVTSIAPGEVARTVKGGTASLKAGAPAKASYEANRTQAKRKVEALHATLTSPEQVFVHGRASRFMESTQNGVSPSRRRSIPSLRASSPERDPKSVLADEVAGGAYLAAPPLLGPLTLPPSDESIGMYVTSPFRGLRPD